MLEKEDLDNIELRLENTILKAFNVHRDKEHKPADERVDKIEKRFLRWGGIITGISLTYGFALKFLF